MSETREYRCVIEWDIDAEDPIDAAHLMWSSVRNSGGPIVSVWTGSDRSVEVDLSYLGDTRDTEGRTAEEYHRMTRAASVVMTPHGRWSTPETDDHGADIGDASSR